MCKMDKTIFKKLFFYNKLIQYNNIKICKLKMMCYFIFFCIFRSFLLYLIITVAHAWAPPHCPLRCGLLCRGIPWTVQWSATKQFLHNQRRTSSSFFTVSVITDSSIIIYYNRYCDYDRTRCPQSIGTRDVFISVFFL